MRSKTLLILFSSLIITVGYLTPVQAVTDAELEALEKQLEQQETEEKKQTEAEARRKAEELKNELEKQKLQEDQKRLAKDQRKLEEEKRKLEEAQLVELERKREKEAAKKKSEQQKTKKYNLLISEAEQAIKDKDKELAISKYNEALLVTPDSSVAKSGLKQAEKLMDRICYDVLGEWSWKDGAAKLILKDDGTLDYIYWGNHTGHWQCSNPALRQIYVNITALGFTQDWNPVLSQDKTCLRMKLAVVGPECLYRPNKNKENKVPANSTFGL
jgi:actin-related protein